MQFVKLPLCPVELHAYSLDYSTFFLWLFPRGVCQGREINGGYQSWLYREEVHIGDTILLLMLRFPHARLA